MTRIISKERLKELEEISNLSDEVYLKRVLSGDLPLDETALYRIIRKVLEK